MLYSAKRDKLVGHKLNLPAWIRAPLTLNNGAPLQFCLDPTPNLEHSEFLDAFISPFQPRSWSDLWRIELETIDKVGILKDVLQILQAKRLAVIASEGSVAANGEHHIMSIVVSAVAYDTSPIDKDHHSRSNKPLAALQDLENEIAIHMIEHIRLSGRNRLRLKIRRLDTYWRLYCAMSQQQLMVPTELRIKNSQIELPRDTVGAIRSALGVAKDAVIHYTPSVDTKERIIRVLFFSETDRAPCYIQIFVPTTSGLLASVVDCISRQRHNIVRFQVRLGGNKMSKVGSRTNDVSGLRVDVTFSPTVAGRKKTAMLSNLKAEIERIEGFGLSGARVLQIAGGETKDD